MFTFKRSKIRTIAPPPPNLNLPTVTTIAQTPAKMIWGQHVWNLIHSMTVLVKDEEFLRIKTECLNILFLVCSHLPCPICSDHAKQYLKSINLNAIQNKMQFKNLFHQFHNNVNAKKNYPLFPREKLEETYEKAILNNMFTNFMLAFKDMSYNQSHIGDQHIRMRILKMFSEWFMKNRDAFD